jgi:hypothetical protein
LKWYFNLIKQLFKLLYSSCWEVGWTKKISLVDCFFLIRSIANKLGLNGFEKLTDRGIVQMHPGEKKPMDQMNSLLSYTSASTNRLQSADFHSGRE